MQMAASVPTVMALGNAVETVLTSPSLEMTCVKPLIDPTSTEVPVAELSAWVVPAR